MQSYSDYPVPGPSQNRPVTPEHIMSTKKTSTPIRSGRPVTSSDYYGGDLEMQRKLVVEDVCHLSQVSTQAFLTYALPTFPLDRVASLRAQLSSNVSLSLVILPLLRIVRRGPLGQPKYMR